MLYVSGKYLSDMSDVIKPAKIYSTEEIFNDPNRFLDLTLDILAQTSIKAPQHIGLVFSNGRIQVSQRDALIVFTKLKKDGYIDMKPDALTELEEYYITFEGLQFRQNGGYVQAHIDILSAEMSDALSAKEIQVNSTLTRNGTLIAAAATSCLVLVEIIKRLGWVVSINILTASFLFFLGATLGLTTLYLITKKL